jgi:hypothetical protein
MKTQKIFILLVGVLCVNLMFPPIGMESSSNPKFSELPNRIFRTPNINAGSYEMHTDAEWIVNDHIELMYEDIVHGTITDPSEILLTSGEPIDLMLNDLRYAYGSIEADDQFHIPIDSMNLYSTDVRDLPGVIVESEPLTEYDDTRSIELKYGGTTRTRELQGIRERYLQCPSTLNLTYRNLDLEPLSNVQSFEGMHVDILISDVYSLFVGAVFTNLEIQLIDENGTGEDIIWTQSIPWQIIEEAMLATTDHYVYIDMWVHQIPIEISFQELNVQRPGFNISTIDQIKIIGAKTGMHPNYSPFDPTLSYVALINAGIYLVDILNNATRFAANNPAGEEVGYEMSCYLPDRGETAIEVNSVYFPHQTINLTATMHMENFHSRIQPVVVDQILFGGSLQIPESRYCSSFPLTLSHQWDNGTRELFGIGRSLEVSSEDTFDLIIASGLYQNISLDYGGNPFFALTEIVLKDSVGISIPHIETYYVSPEFPSIPDDLTLHYTYVSVDGLSEQNSLIEWYCDGIIQPHLSDLLVVPNTDHQYQEEWYASITPHDGESYGPQFITDTVLIGNIPPAFIEYTFGGAAVYAIDDLQLHISYADPDGAWEDIGVTIRWYCNELYRSEFDNHFEIFSENLHEGDHWTVNASIYDRYDYGDPGSESKMIAVNTLPEFTYPLEVTIDYTDGVQTVSWQISDTTCRNPTYVFYLDGEIGDMGDWNSETGEITFNFAGLAIGDHVVALNFNDGCGANVTKTMTIRILEPNLDPSIPGFPLGFLLGFFGIALFVKKRKIQTLA